MKIIHITWALNLGGAESVLVDILREQSKAHTVLLIIINNSFNSSLLKQACKVANVIQLKRKRGKGFLNIFIKLNVILTIEKPDVIHCHNYKLHKLIKFQKRKKIFLTAHSLKIPPHGYYGFGKIFAISDSVRDNIINNTNIVPIVLYNGVNASLIKRKVNWSFNFPFKILQIGRLDSEIKGQHITVKALFLLRNKYDFKNFKMTFIGKGPSDKYIEDMAKKHNILEKVEFKGEIDRNELVSIIHKYDLLVQPSLYEGFGITVVEAMVANVPVLVSKGGGPQEILQNGKYGWMFDNGDYVDFAKKINEIIGLYCKNEIRQKVYLACRYARKRYSIKNTALCYLNNY